MHNRRHPLNLTQTIMEQSGLCIRMLEAMPASEQAECPLWGIPFAVKDNIDVEGFPTTAACREFGQQPAATSAPTVQALTDAGQRSMNSLYTRTKVLTKAQRLSFSGVWTC